jgi:poly-gamma-glutamate capsule biosynthesis protein CapA/YwtB (metallophosphatase superfamily)
MEKFFIQLLVILLLFWLSTGCSSHPPLQTVFDDTVYVAHDKVATLKRLPLSEPVQAPMTSIVAVGDIMIGSHVAYFLNKFGVGYPFDSTRQILISGDATIGNLEAPFSKTGTQFEKEFAFKIHPKYARGLPAAGFDVFTLANNHTMDFGKDALINTMRTLDTLGIGHCGAGVSYSESKKPALFTKDGITFAFLGYSCTFPKEFWARHDSAGTCSPNESDMVESIRACKKIADYTIASFHWGQELRDTPKDYQIYLAHLAIDAGADLILGHHPHILQGMEIYKNRLIIYSLGNFTFGAYSENAKESMIVKVYLTYAGLAYARVYPLSVYNNDVNFQPKVVDGQQAQGIFTHLNEISAALNNHAIIVNENGLIWGNGKMPTPDVATITNEGSSHGN